MKAKLRMVLAMGVLVIAVFGSAPSPASADRICARVTHTIDIPGTSVATDTVCVPLP